MEKRTYYDIYLSLFEGSLEPDLSFYYKILNLFGCFKLSFEDDGILLDILSDLSRKSFDDGVKFAISFFSNDF